MLAERSIRAGIDFLGPKFKYLIRLYPVEILVPGITRSILSEINGLDPFDLRRIRLSHSASILLSFRHERAKDSQ